MKLKLPTDLYNRAKACAGHPLVDMPVGEWCGVACKVYGDADTVANDSMSGVATTVATINGEWEATVARAAIAAGVEFAEGRHAKMPLLSASEKLAKSNELNKAIEDGNKYIAERMRKIEEAA